MLALLGLAAGIIIGLLVEPVLPVFLQPYLPIAIVAVVLGIRIFNNAAAIRRAVLHA